MTAPTILISTQKSLFTIERIKQRTARIKLALKKPNIKESKKKILEEELAEYIISHI
ncbi:MAG: hypothetical protein ACR2MX_01605 [Cyclobacteriaceae bacterium]